RTILPPSRGLPRAGRRPAPTGREASHPMIRRTLAPLLLALGLAPFARADDQVYFLDRPPLLPPTAVLCPGDDGGARQRVNRIRLFGMQPGFLYGPPGLDVDAPVLAAQTGTTTADDGPSWLQLSMGGDNPFFDARRPGDPGGVGYYRLHSQVQLFDSRTTS